MTATCNFIIMLWPLLVSSLAFFFHNKQNNKNAWTGGPISWPKSFWLAYTTTTWFLLPIVILIHPNFPTPLTGFFLVHLLSWWIRGPLELVMIYKWLNWTPKYGISHDAFHIIICGIFLALSWPMLHLYWATDMGVLATVFAVMVIFSTCAEIFFAAMFLRFRSQQEEKENIYFASDDPKWILINRITLTVVVIVMGHLLWQSCFIFKGLVDGGAALQ